SEMEIRKKLIESGGVDVIITISSNFFYTVTLPATLWFFDRAKEKSKRKDQILFIDARNIFRQVDRAHRDFTPDQIEYIANIVRLYRGEKPESLHGGEKLLKETFPKKKYEDVPGLCKLASRSEVEGHDWSLNPGRYVGVAPGQEVSDEDFKAQLEGLSEELENLNSLARTLEATIATNLAGILEV